VFAVDPISNIYIVSWWRGQTSSDVWVEKQCDFIREHSPACWFGEAGPIRRAVSAAPDERARRLLPPRMADEYVGEDGAMPAVSGFGEHAQGLHPSASAMEG
jgi:hypothetical protein